MNDAIEISGLRKQYKNFLLDEISFSVPAGFVCVALSVKTVREMGLCSLMVWNMPGNICF